MVRKITLYTYVFLLSDGSEIEIRAVSKRAACELLVEELEKRCVVELISSDEE